MSRIHARTSLVLAVIAVSVVAVTLPSGAGSVSPTPVLTTPDVWEDFPAYGSTGSTPSSRWTRNSKAKPNAFNAFLVNLAIKGADPIRVNPTNDAGLHGRRRERAPALAAGQARAVRLRQLYDYSSEARTSHLRPASTTRTGSRARPPRRRRAPTCTGEPLQLARRPVEGDPGHATPRRPIDKIVLDKAKNRCKCIWPGQVVGDYATWTKCTATCQVWIYEISSRHTTRVSNDPVRKQYHGVPDTNGAVYLARGGTPAARTWTSFVRLRPIGVG